MNRCNLYSRRTISGLSTVFLVWAAGAQALPTGDLPDRDLELAPISLGRDSARSIEPFSNDTRTPSASAAKRDDVERHGNPLWAIPLSTLSVTRERPIFTASRRAPARVVAIAPPPEPARPPPPPPSPETPRLTLVGSVVNDQQGIAIFMDQSTGKTIRLKVGDGHVGWILRLVRGRETTLEKDHQTVVVKLPLPGEAPLNLPVQPATFSGGVPGVLPGLQDLTAHARGQLPPPTISLAPTYDPGRVPSATGRVPGL